jgi:putative intracellular protease/amidase
MLQGLLETTRQSWFHPIDTALSPNQQESIHFLIILPYRQDTMCKDQVVRIGVFIPTECQVLDQAPVDIFACMSHEYLSLLALIPAHVKDLAPSVQIHYIGSVQPGEPIEMTANQRILATNHYSDPTVAPGKLDIVLVPGPDPNVDFTEDKHREAVDWLRRQSKNEGTDILSICTGVYLCGAAGLLEGRTVCGPRGLQDAIKSKFGKNMTLKGAELRWVQDGNFWSSGKQRKPSYSYVGCLNH